MDDQDYELAFEQAGEALSRMSCPYYQGKGICDQGCHVEPACQVDTPAEGWEVQLLKAAQALADVDVETTIRRDQTAKIIAYLRAPDLNSIAGHAQRKADANDIEREFFR